MDARPTKETGDAYKQRDGEGPHDHYLRKRATMEKLERERDDARDEVERLLGLGMEQVTKELSGKTMLKALEYRDGRTMMELEPAMEIATSFAACARTILGDAPNYTESKLECQISEAGSADVWTFVVQRHAPGAMTPHEARMKAERERDEAIQRDTAHREMARLQLENITRERDEAREVAKLLADRMKEFESIRDRLGYLWSDEDDEALERYAEIAEQTAREVGV